jgi:hypothetical protein
LSDHKWQIGPVKLANGEEAFIDAINEGQEAFRYTGRVKLNDQWVATGWDESGRRMFAINNSPNNLAPPPKKKVRVRVFVNCYASGSFFSYVDRETADRVAGSTRIACKEIDIEVEEGEGL